MKIVVLAGGNSAEREVSLSSGSLISNALMENGHEVMLVDLLLGNKSDIEMKYRKKGDILFEYKINKTEPNIDEIMNKYNLKSLVGEGVIEACKDADIVYNALHGGIGENGSISNLLELFNIKHTASDTYSSMISMDKSLTKDVMDRVGIKNAKSFIITDNNYDLKNIKYPVVLKPCSNGSSVGVRIVNNEEEFLDAIEYAKKYENKILIEEYIKGREFSVSVLDGEALAPIEIIPNDGFYDYEHKYQGGKTLEVCPANISKEIDNELRKNALLLHNAVGLATISRTDFILTEDNEIYALEINSLPGMTPTSLLPQEAKEKGITYNELVEIIVNKSK